MAVPCPADTPNDLQQQLTQAAAELKIKLRPLLYHGESQCISGNLAQE